ncbi:helix-turn-helix domain-containing protein [Plastoroseomonas hellenica]|uniref:helix-turn-helix domain-containing protein n=1 Tax=Plastoroseomonas hellenica TaxID=2687306 RepID=UPI001FE29AD8|nr:helix-turn-helix transcriptional regulator [Plastoroseomonas hellenica]
MNQQRSNLGPGLRDVRTLLLTPEQCRAARGLLDMTRNQLAAEAHVSLATLLQFENNERPVKTSTQALIRMALEASGVLFIPEGDAGVGVRFRDRGAQGDTPEHPDAAAEEGRDPEAPDAAGYGTSPWPAGPLPRA